MNLPTVRPPFALATLASFVAGTALFGCSSGSSTSPADAGTEADSAGHLDATVAGGDSGGMDGGTDSSQAILDSSSGADAAPDSNAIDTGTRDAVTDTSTSDGAGDATTAADASTDTSTKVDAGADANSSDGGGDATIGPDAGRDASPSMDTGTDSSSADAALPRLDSGLGGSCISALYDTYVQRVDGPLLSEGESGEQPVKDAVTGTPLVGIVSVQDGRLHGCAAVASGSAECWQRVADANLSGQLGNGTTAGSTVVFQAAPVLTAANTPLTQVVAVGDGRADTGCAVTGGGRVWCWGDLTWLVNNGTTLYSGYALPITTDGTTPLTGVLQVAIGAQAACVLVQGAPNTIWCWGNNTNGELGQSDTSFRRYPTKVVGLTNPTGVAAASFNENGETMCALDGTNVSCWGSNGSGAAGINTTTNLVLSPTLVQVQAGTALSNVVDIRGGSFAFSVLRNDGTLWNWGEGAAAYAAAYGDAGVLLAGSGGGFGSNGPRYLTRDGVYHYATAIVTVNCGPL